MMCFSTTKSRVAFTPICTIEKCFPLSLSAPRGAVFFARSFREDDGEE